MTAFGDAAPTIEGVADHRMPDRGKMRADLMHDAGLDLHFEEGRVRTATNRSKASQGRPRSTRGFLEHSHLAAVVRVRLDRSLHLADARHRAQNDGHVELADPSAAKLQPQRFPR